MSTDSQTTVSRDQETGLDLMIDLETLDTTRESIVTQVGMVIFDPYSEYISTILRSPVLLTLDDQKSLRTMNVDTVVWWLNTNAALFKKLMTDTDRTSVGVFLAQLSNLIQGSQFRRIWANSPSFDLEILKSMYDQNGVKNPIHFRKERDLRTIKDIAAVGIPEVEAELLRRGYKIDEAHNAHYDALFQAVQVQLCYKKLGFWKTTVNVEIVTK